MRLNDDEQRHVLSSVSRETLDALLFTNRDFSLFVSRQMNGVCLRDVWSLKISRLVNWGFYRVKVCVSVLVVFCNFRFRFGVLGPGETSGRLSPSRACFATCQIC